MAADRATRVPDGPAVDRRSGCGAWLGECGEIDHVELLLGRADARTPADGERKPAARETWADVTGERGGERGAYCFCHFATRMLKRPSRRRRVARCDEGAFVNHGVHCAKQATAPRPVVTEQPEQREERMCPGRVASAVHERRQLRVAAGEVEDRVAPDAGQRDTHRRRHHICREGGAAEMLAGRHACKRDPQAPLGILDCRPHRVEHDLRAVRARKGFKLMTPDTDRCDHRLQIARQPFGHTAVENDRVDDVATTSAKLDDLQRVSRTPSVWTSRASGS